MNFGQPTTSSFSFGAPAATTQQQTTAPTTTGFSFGSLGGGDSTANRPLMGGFGTPQTSAPSFAIGANTTTAALPTLGAGAPSTGFSFGATTGTPAATSAPSLSFGSIPQPTVGAINLPTTSAPTELSFNTQKTTPSLTTTTTTVPASTGFLQISNPSTTSVPTLGAFSFAGTTPIVTSTTTTTSASIPTSLTTGTTTTQSTAGPATQLNFCELEELINKWTLVLEEQEKVYTNQATQVNAWDKVLISNGDKIVALNEAVEKVKAEQHTLEQELEFISAQHSELEECITPLQTELSKIPQVDVERAQIYLLAENLDTQLKQMSEDLKEVVEHLNEANKAQDPNDPIVQIGRILNAHMSSLQWIETSSSLITNKLDDITKIHETLKRDNERNLRFVYYDQ